MRRQIVHINLNKLAAKLLADPAPARKTGPLMTVPSDPDELLKLLQGERLSMTDYEFRKRYAAWL